MQDRFLQAARFSHTGTQKFGSNVAGSFLAKMLTRSYSVLNFLSAMTFTPPLLRKALIGIMSGNVPRSKNARQMKACIFKLDRIGDFVLALSAIRQLTNYYGEVNCALVVFQPIIDLARREFPNATLIALPQHGGGIGNAFKLFPASLSQFTKYHFENLICFRYQRTLVHHLVLSRIHAKRSIGFANSTDWGVFPPDEKIFQFSFAESLPLPNRAPELLCIELERHKKLVSHVLGKTVSREQILPALISVQPKRGEQLVVVPFSSQLIKDYPEQSLIAALKIIRASTNVPISLCGARPEQDRLRRLLVNAKALGISHISMQISNSLSDFTSLIAQARAILTMDTAAAHLATAMDKPTVIILGGGHFRNFGPWYRSPKQSWLTNELHCFGCNWECIHTTSICITEIPSKRVADAVLGVLS